MRKVWDFLKYRLLVLLMLFVYIVSPVAALYWFFWGTMWKCLCFIGVFIAGIVTAAVICARARKRNEELFAAMLAEQNNNPAHIEDDTPREDKTDRSTNEQKKTLFRADAVITAVLFYGTVLVLLAVMSVNQ